MTQGPQGIRQRAPMGRAPAQHQQPTQGGGIRSGINNSTALNQGGGMRGGQPQQQQREFGGVQGYEQVRAMNERQAQIEARRAQERADGYQPLRFYLPSPNKQGVRRDELSAHIIILDHAPEFAVFEHQFPNPQTGRMGRGAFTHLCLHQEGHCPACDADQKDPYYALMLTVMDMRSYTRDDGRVVPYSRKILCVKNRNQDYFYRQYEREGTLRGMQLLMVRNDPRGANHGNPEFVAIHPEEAIIAEFQHAEVRSQDGQRVIKEANEDCYPFDYSKVFAKPDYQQMLERFGGAPAAGSSHDAQSTWGADAGQFGSAQSRLGGGGGIAASIQGGGRGTPGGIAARIQNGGGIMQRGTNQMQGGQDDEGYDEGSAEDGAQYQTQQGRTTLQQDLDDTIPFEQGTEQQEQVEQPAQAAQPVRTRSRAGAAQSQANTDRAVTDPSQIPL